MVNEDLKAIIDTCLANDECLKFSDAELKDMIVDGKHLKQINRLIHRLALVIRDITKENAYE
jgi:hypothetical protein